LGHKVLDDKKTVLIIGGGFTGLTTAYYLARSGTRVTVLESDEELGGLAGSFTINGTRIEKFYHHWFTNDSAAMKLINDLGLQKNILIRPTRTGVYSGNRLFRLSSPLDLLRFKPLSFMGRIRLGFLTLYARRVKNWKSLENKTAIQWLREIGGDEVYKVVWEPLLRGKFGEAAKDVSAVWIWNKLKLRGGSRGKGGGEKLAYFKGGFSALVDAMAEEIHSLNGSVVTNAAVTALLSKNHKIEGVMTDRGQYTADIVVATPSIPIISNLLKPYCSTEYISDLNRIKYLANICIVLELKHSLSSTYWLNVNDPNFPFVAVIEHTNFEHPESFGGSHIVYLSKYLPENSKLFKMTDKDTITYTLKHLKRMFPKLDDSWILSTNVWRARYSQPVVSKHYSKIIPAVKTPLENLYLTTMAQIYPEDRGTNYAILQGQKLASRLLKKERI
jgi:protoporphyrinogen oxidase